MEKYPECNAISSEALMCATVHRGLALFISVCTLTTLKQTTKNVCGRRLAVVWKGNGGLSYCVTVIINVGRTLILGLPRKQDGRPVGYITLLTLISRSNRGVKNF